MNFRHICLFPELFIRNFFSNFNNEHAQDYSCPGATFVFCSHGAKLSQQGGITRCCTMGNPPLEVAPGQRKTHVNSYRHQTVHRSKVDPGVGELGPVHMIPGQLIAPGQLTDPGVNFASVHGLTPVTVHMSLSWPQGNLERQVTRC